MAISTEDWNKHWIKNDVNRMRLEWVYEKDNDCYKIYTKEKVIKTNENEYERQHIANVFSKTHAHQIVLYHNYFIENEYPI